MEMSEKIGFAIAEETMTISESFRADIQHDTEDTYSYDYSVDITLKCTEKPDESGVGLWQWVTESADRVSKTLSLHTVCRYGSLYNQSP